MTRQAALATAATALALAACSLEPQPKALGLGGAVVLPFCLIACTGHVTIEQIETTAPTTIAGPAAPIVGGSLTVAPDGVIPPAPPAPPPAAK